MELSVEQVGSLSLSDIEKNTDSKDIGPEKQLIVEDETEPEEQKESEDVQNIEKEETDETFIGSMGNYTYTDSEGNVMGKITITQVENTCDFTLSVGNGL